MNNLKCVHATNGIRVTNDGTAMLCCMSKETLTDNNGEIARVSSISLDDILHGKKAIEIRQDLDAGIQHPNCQRCWDEEAVGVASKRIRDNSNYQFTDTSLKIAELNLGTACNLKCRTCSPWASSQWNKEFLLVNDHAPPKAEYDRMLYNLNHSYDDDSIFWESFKEKLSSVEQIDMYGGEPFMIKKQWELLQYSIDQGYSKNQTLHFNTNGTYFDYDKIEILKHFKQIDISVSIDGIGPQFEYQRHPAKWDILLENLTKFKECAEKYNWCLSACVTVTNHNIFSLDYILTYLEEFGVNPYANLLHDPSYYNIKNLRSDIKTELTEKFLNFEGSVKVKHWLEKVVSFMNSASTDHDQWLKFQEMVLKLDKIRNEDFKKVFPDYYNRVVKKNSKWSYEKIKYLHVELTNKCNAACPICPRYLDHTETVDPSITLDEITYIQFTEYFSKELLSSVIQLTFCGTHGDPMMARDVIDIVEYSIKCNPTIRINFNTNGGIRDTKFWRNLGSILKGHRHCITFSIDGLEDTNHLYRRNVKWNYLIKNVSAFISAGGIAEWDFLIFKHNEHQVLEATNLSKELGFVKFNPKRALGFSTPIGGYVKPVQVYDKTGNFKYWIEPPTDLSFHNGIGIMIDGNCDFNLEETMIQRNNLSDKNLDVLYNEYQSRKIKCRTLNKNSFSEIYVNANGYVLPCCYIGSVVTGYYAVEHEYQIRKIFYNHREHLNLKTHSLKDIIDSEILDQLFSSKWTCDSFNDGKPVFCSMSCGEHNPLDRLFIKS